MFDSHRASAACTRRPASSSLLRFTFASLPLLLLLFVTTTITPTHAVPVLFPMNHPAIWSTPWNWYLNTAVSPVTLTTNHVGAYLKFTVQSTSQLTLLIDTSMLPAGGPYSIVRFYIDSDITNSNLTDWYGEPTQGINGRWYVPTDTISVVQNGVTYQALQVARALDTTVPHTVMILLRAADSSFDRWNSVATTNLLRLLYIMLDGDGSQTIVAPTLRPRRILFYWDGLGEGLNTEASGLARAIDQNDVTHTFAFVVARAMQAEISMAAFKQMSWMYNGAGNVPWFYNLNASTYNTRAGYNPAYPAWSYMWFNQSRLVANGTVFSPTPDYIFAGIGPTDVAQSSPTAALPLSITGWLGAVRQAAPTSRVFLCIPIGSQIATILRTSFATYQTAANDTLTSLIDLGSEAARGLVQTANVETPVASISYDCVYPIWLRSVQIGNMMATRVQQALGWI